MPPVVGARAMLGDKPSEGWHCPQVRALGVFLPDHQLALERDTTTHPLEVLQFTGASNVDYVGPLKIGMPASLSFSELGPRERLPDPCGGRGQNDPEDFDRFRLRVAAPPEQLRRRRADPGRPSRLHRGGHKAVTSSVHSNPPQVHSPGSKYPVGNAGRARPSRGCQTLGRRSIW